MAQAPKIKTGRVARQLDLSENRVRQLADRGVIPSVRTADGMRLFDPADVAKFAAERALIQERRSH